MSVALATPDNAVPPLMAREVGELGKEILRYVNSGLGLANNNDSLDVAIDDDSASHARRLLK